ncbi:hypothetical protein BDE27_1855 [Xenorhabdus ehlersii]|uniref:Uncharacterized protein n=1 Tax=Xenorhabdus ehlersii TaxID=290111 RepID=A0A2D0IWN1_9GAMM|nr:hypothetical protein [Xenorhabdus sp. TS4]PHM26350.1 hypothetical protein Xehl_00682 [Xenorhabdus ehlersii]RKE91596.1 hypothetical protein BDE27_1855 [Xenorhabdus ehlersii]
MKYRRLVRLDVRRPRRPCPDAEKFSVECEAEGGGGCH